tara:strand:+ start:120 stop:305 length:186 start_codon:yes stop_codon:yes gene_type:complete
MYYHPFLGITIFILAIIISFILGRLYIKKKLNLVSRNTNSKNTVLPKGEITSPDAPWLNKK